jgi:hypothetical protein
MKLWLLMHVYPLFILRFGWYVLFVKIGQWKCSLLLRWSRGTTRNYYSALNSVPTDTKLSLPAPKQSTALILQRCWFSSICSFTDNGVTFRLAVADKYSLAWRQHSRLQSLIASKTGNKDFESLFVTSFGVTGNWLEQFKWRYFTGLA